MLRLFAVLGLVTVALLNLGGAHRYKGSQYRQTKNVTDYVDKVPTWEEAHGYGECQEFLNDPQYNEDYVEGEDANVVADNGMHHLLSRHMPKPIEEICSSYECPKFERLDSAGCGFETVIIPKGYWMVSDIDKEAPLPAREAYKRVYQYRSGKMNDRNQKMRFVVPVMKKYYLDGRAELGMYIPAEFQSDPPKSTYDQVRIELWDEAKVYIRPYGGYREELEFDQQFDLLKLALAKVNIIPDPNVKVIAGYTYMRYGRQRIEAMLFDSAYDSASDSA